MTVMKKIKVAEATPLQLNWLTAKVEGVKIRWDAELEVLVYFDREEGRERDWSPVEDGSQTTAIIERETLELLYDRSGRWAEPWRAMYCYRSVRGPTASIAVLRYNLVNKLGDEVEVPEELKK